MKETKKRLAGLCLMSLMYEVVFRSGAKEANRPIPNPSDDIAYLRSVGEWELYLIPEPPHRWIPTKRELAIARAPKAGGERRA